MKLGLPLIKRDDHFTYKMYREWPDDERWELIHGVAYNMCAAPRRIHQELLGILFNAFYNHLKGKPCKAYMAPFDVRLPEADENDDDIDTVVQPDIIVFCDNDKLDELGARGAPDIAVEILSPSTSKKDLSVKFDLYEEQQVKEYWILEPQGKWMQVFTLKDEKFDDGLLFEGKGVFKSQVLKGFELDLTAVFYELKE